MIDSRLEYIHYWRRHMSRRIHSTLRGFQTTRRAMSFNSLCKEALSSGKKVIAVDADDVLASTNAKVAESECDARMIERQSLNQG